MSGRDELIPETLISHRADQMPLSLRIPKSRIDKTQLAMLLRVNKLQSWRYKGTGRTHVMKSSRPALTGCVSFPNLA